MRRTRRPQAMRRKRLKSARIGMPPASRWKSDHGKGLSEEAELKAGSAFFTTKTEGHGIGLFLANATLERLGGSVRLFNREQGGATTKIILPITRTDI